ncbi:transglutaminase-like cysteine peptidase [Ferrimonas lipolytica]|uniref:Sulfate adenylyltransferase n=1 Tax=Ferrimonas lipolytica TaxID=2724191 RepID=A0A6H1UI82_9GAMM|nr:transglutaminase-like cysteine peptidase [Ferrimonas lipolytica]QIZ78023.1 sulfate adenylyltransferase [Ferrimonas lipolytica]
MAGTSAPPEMQARQQEQLVFNYGDQAALRYRAWRNLLEQQQQNLPLDQATAVNNFFNQFRFGNDIDIWNKKNYWATPMEFIGIANGDCEDFALAKYITLQMLGFPTESLRLVYVKAVQLNQFHMVVAYYPTPASEPLLLDNINGNITKASKRPDLKPIFSFSGDKLWLDGAAGSQQLTDRPALTQWTQFNRRRMDGTMNLPSYLKGS